MNISLFQLEEYKPPVNILQAKGGGAKILTLNPVFPIVPNLSATPYAYEWITSSSSTPRAYSLSSAAVAEHSCIGECSRDGDL